MSKNPQERAMVRILGYDGKSVVGAGFLISSCHVITSAHVVEDALGPPGKTSTGPSKTLNLDFPLMQSNKTVQARVQLVCPVQEHPCQDSIEDIAVLKITSPKSVPEGAQPVSFPKIAERDLSDLEVKMFGFPKGYDNGLWVDGVIRGNTGDGWTQINHAPGTQVVTHGFSGAPVWEKQACTVVGMIVCKKECRDGISTAYMIPSSKILSICPKIVFQGMGKQPLGKIIPKTCNRKGQDEAFWDFFRRRYKGFPNQPQFYICYGKDGECHRSLIERLINDRIKSYFGNEWKKTILPNTVYPPSQKLRGNPKSCRETLARELIEKLEKGYVDMDYSLKTLFRLPVLKRYQLFIIIHEFLISEWNKNYSAIIEWYLKDYWSGTEWTDDVPQFLIFLNIRYKGSQNTERISMWDRFLLGRIGKALTRVQKSVGESCLLFEPLEPIKSIDVSRWFSDNMRGIFNEMEVEQKISSIYNKKKQVCMAEIEGKLKEFCNDFSQDKSKLHE